MQRGLAVAEPALLDHVPTARVEPRQPIGEPFGRHATASLSDNDVLGIRTLLFEVLHRIERAAAVAIVIVDQSVEGGRRRPPFALPCG
jgi:hypothetical protein